MKNHSKNVIKNLKYIILFYVQFGFAFLYTNYNQFTLNRKLKISISAFVFH